jgi:parallel beta-helix repeat protein
MNTILMFALMAKLLVVAPGSDLQAVIDRSRTGDTIYLKIGQYQAKPIPYVEKICGNCTEPLTQVTATVGFKVEGKALTIMGEDRSKTILVTGAGYGVLFERAHGSQILYLTVTGGVRDPDGRATDAGIVVKNGRVTVESVDIVDNTHRIDSVVVGIGGIFGREGSEIMVFNNLIKNNGWDGIALYRGATGVIADNVIEQGRGAGIGITWDASAVVYRNRISGYWKGIGTFGESRAIVRNNAVYNNLGWGVIASGKAYMEVLNNVIYHNGNCGFAVWDSTASGVFKNNIVARNGWREEWVCPCVGVWMAGIAGNFPLSYNDNWDNKAGEYAGMEDMAEKSGNIARDPIFDDTLSFILKSGSPGIDAGDPFLIDPDGSRSDLGIHGGPWAK